MIVVRSDAHRPHHVLELDHGNLIRSWDSPARADSVDRAVDASGAFEVCGPDPLDRSVVGALHSPDYLEFLETGFARWRDAGHDAECAMAFGWPARRMGQRLPTAVEAQLGYYSFAADCSIGEHTWEAALDSAALAQTAASIVADGRRAAFARCRPPGHHAGRDIFGGYCYLNNAAVAAEVLRRAGVGRVGILDVDYHHGNGTQDIFYERDDVVFCSIHADPATDFPYFLGYSDEQGGGAGEGRNRNLPLPAGTDAGRWLTALDEAIAWLGLLRVEALVVSLGVDTFEGDPISHFTLGCDAYPVIGERIGAAGLPSVFVLEGGYASEKLGENVVSVLAGFSST